MESGWEKAAIVPQSSILRLAEKSGNERDKLIEKHMVSIVSHILSLASLLCFRSPGPFISRDTIVHAVQTVVDGFLEMCIAFIHFNFLCSFVEPYVHICSYCCR
ncbi:hypothetical protein ACB092_03G112200 [Castanea dentata]